MDLDRMTPTARQTLCRRYFIIGIFGLPFLWLINAIWFGHFVFVRKGVAKTKKSAAPGLGGGPAGPGHTTSRS